MEAAGWLFCKMAEAAGCRAHMMEMDLGRMVQSLRRGPLTHPVSQVVIHAPGGTQVLTGTEEVEEEARVHFKRHFTHTGGEEVDIATKAYDMITAHAQPIPFTQRCRLAQGDALSPLLWITVYDPLLTKIRGMQETYASSPEMPGVNMAALAYADDLTLIGRTREDLQRTMDMAATWFATAGVCVNAEKTVLIEWPQNQTTQTHLQWQQEEGPVPITQIAAADEPVQILGQYLTPEETPKR
ncbi:hypothetical protein H4R24_005635 [Coemansia sp. RSA 988]|nr:hypothetical protein H4R24_005635 [Coemansia sp. RSA 988]